MYEGLHKTGMPEGERHCDIVLLPSRSKNGLWLCLCRPTENSEPHVIEARNGR